MAAKRVARSVRTKADSMEWKKAAHWADPSVQTRVVRKVVPSEQQAADCWAAWTGCCWAVWMVDLSAAPRAARSARWTAATTADQKAVSLVDLMDSQMVERKAVMRAHHWAGCWAAQKGNWLVGTSVLPPAAARAEMSAIRTAAPTAAM